MMSVDWNVIFPGGSDAPPASAEELERLRDDLRRPLSTSEVQTLVERQRNPFPASDPCPDQWRPLDPRSWRLPAVPLPPTYLSFLGWSNGGFIQSLRMEFGFFATHELRGFMLDYEVPHYMPMAIPLGLDGSGNFALFDARSPLEHGEYPVLVAPAGDLDFDDAHLIASSFESFCRRTAPVEDALDLPPLRPPTEHELAEREARFAAQAARQARKSALALADAAFKSGDFERVVELLAPYRGSLQGSVELKLRMAEKRAKQ